MIAVAPAEQSDRKARVNDNACGDDRSPSGASSQSCADRRQSTNRPIRSVIAVGRGRRVPVVRLNRSRTTSDFESLRVRDSVRHAGLPIMHEPACRYAYADCKAAGTGAAGKTEQIGAERWCCRQPCAGEMAGAAIMGESCVKHHCGPRPPARSEEDPQNVTGRARKSGQISAEEPGREPNNRASPQFAGRLRHDVATVTPR